ncbi:hypothetical protein H9Q13_03175 [Pontibacter sp. JH31]|uniref:Uncharacterized protein n=1 Tax=Pontibacter aquaedesilientis TaxID=2766980 RepID=A0ABR7XCY2_9BACT|nr:hypothetical protein [Pontibacter aquaedesilientis]MBD1396155.1 hypothetical protein [Pontibacter aquaedesilientis]
MAALTPEQLNAEFLRHFMPETLYLIDGDQMVPVVHAPETVPTAAVSQQAIPVQADVQAPKSNVAALPATVPPAAPVAAIPKLPKVEVTPPQKAFDIIGENRKGLVVLVTLPDAAFRALPQSQFLTKILAAIGFGPSDVAFVNNVSGAIAKFEALRNSMQTNYILSFASRIDTDLPHEKFTLYNPVLLAGVPVVFSQSLAVLDGDQEQKKLLWGALQQVFK